MVAIYVAVTDTVAELSRLRILPALSFSRQGLYWFIPLLLTLSDRSERAYPLHGGQQPECVLRSRRPPPISRSAFLLWYLIIITFHYALKKTIRINRYEADMRKTFMKPVIRRRSKAAN